MKRRFFLALLLTPSLVWAHSYKQGDIEIGHAWALPSLTIETSVMFPMLNTGSQADALISVSSSTAQSVELRDGDAAVAEFTLEPNHPFPMRAAAKHLQLIGLTKALSTGDKLQLVLNFKLAGQIMVDVHVAAKAEE